MSHFDEAYLKTMGHEGGYTNDPDDPGAETYRGISRKWNPDWRGWKIIDQYRRLSSDLAPMLEGNNQLQGLVKEFYHAEFWLPLRCDSMPRSVAAELFDTAVNVGKENAVEMLQHSLNILNRNEKLFEDLERDGTVGPVTLSAIQRVSDKRLVKCMNGFQFCHYAGIYDGNPKMEKFVGWVDRT